jgi:hypothetical protein
LDFLFRGCIFGERLWIMRKAYYLDIDEIEKYYTITEDGMVWSKGKGRWLKPRINVCGYVFYSISLGVGDHALGAFAHTLVALKYIGKPPTDRHEISHEDDNKMNNHYSNLSWLTHSENILGSYARGRRGWWLGRNKPPFSLGTKLRMANAKKKPVRYTLNGHDSIFDSIETASKELGTYRKKIYSCIKEDKMFNGGWFSFVEDDIPKG